MESHTGSKTEWLEQELASLVIDRAAEAAVLFMRSGIDAAMNRYNGALPKD